MKWIIGGAAAAICASVVAVLLVFFRSGEDAAAKVSTDLDALRNTITLDIAANAGTWEIFGTPEYRGGIPAPTDYVTVIAELSLADAGAAFPREPAGRRMVAPEAARPWLSKLRARGSSRSHRPVLRRRRHRPAAYYEQP